MDVLVHRHSGGHQRISFAALLLLERMLFIHGDGHGPLHLLLSSSCLDRAQLEPLAQSPVGGVPKGDDEQDCDEPDRRDLVHIHSNDCAEQRRHFKDQGRVVVDERSIQDRVALADVVDEIHDGGTEDCCLREGNGVMDAEAADADQEGHHDPSSSYPSCCAESGCAEGQEEDEIIVAVEGEQGSLLHRLVVWIKGAPCWTSRFVACRSPSPP
mmetsp:Transcript_27050/g.88440  ORF Transcript_27050/g.88440 Transcript_27050/m.88440 type:complete len:213 (-) Transcript_27050:204-842(-)